MKEVIIYSDGASRGNGTRNSIGAYGIVLYCKGRIKEKSKAFRNVTNNEMELKGVIEGLRMLKEPCKVTVVSDSAYVCNTMNNGWIYRWQRNKWKKKDGKNVANKQLWIDLLEELEQHEVAFKWCKGHSCNNGNNRADELCNIAMDKFIEKEGR